MNSTKKMIYTAEKGITLIALVITIIVLLILAGVTISMVTGDDGIIAQAQKAKEAQKNAEVTDNAEVAKGEAALADYNKKKGLDLTDESMANIESKIETYNNNIENPAEKYTYKNTISKVVDGVPIPVGFAHVQGTKKDTGLIVVDGYGNEFVWVPVDAVKEAGTAINYDDGEVWLIDKVNDASNTPQKNGVPTGVPEDYAKMKNSVKIYGGFYVGRYETSYNGTRVASVGNVLPLHQNQEIDEGVQTTWYTFYKKQQELYSNSSSVVSGMIYGSQWDAIADWMSDVVNPNAVNPATTNKYIKDSTGMGHYCKDKDNNLLPEYKESGLVPIKTGSNLAYSVKNIFDLAGNYEEWTVEKSEETRSSRYVRGGCYNGTNGLAQNMSWHSSISPFREDFTCYSSRLQLYIR